MLRLLLLPLAMTAIAAAPLTQTWTIDPARSEARFTVTKMGYEDVTGVFRESMGEIHFDAANPDRSRVIWRVRVASVFSGEKNRDDTLQAPEYFDAARHPFLEFTSQSVRRHGNGSFAVSGQLTMRGVSRPLSITVRHVTTGPTPRFETAFEVDRYDFGIRGGRVMGRLIGRTVRVQLVAAVTPN